MDYKVVLRKYIDHVRLHEGTTFVGDYLCHNNFSDEEWAALKELEAGADERFAQRVAAMRDKNTVLR